MSDERMKLADKLQHAMVTMQNDDLSQPGTEKRQRHVERYEVMADAVAALRAPEAADAGAWTTKKSMVFLGVSEPQAVIARLRAGHDVAEEAAQMIERLSSPTAAGIAAPPAERKLTTNEARALKQAVINSGALSYEIPPELAAELNAPPAASADAVRKAAEALCLLAAHDDRLQKLHDLLETIREQIRTGVEPEHRPKGLFSNIQDAVYAMRGRMPLMNDAAIIGPLNAKANAALSAPVAGADAGREQQLVEEMMHLRKDLDAACAIIESDAGMRERADTLASDLRHAMTTMQNDDLSAPMTDKRDRHVARYETMDRVREFLAALSPDVTRS